MLDQKQDSIRKKILYSIEQNQKSIHTINSAPGSGKTTLLLNTIIKAIPFLQQQQKKIMLLAFNKEISQELKKKIKRAIPADSLHLIDIRTVNSFFLKGAKQVMENNPDFNFEINYEKSIFSFKDIEYILKSMSKDYSATIFKTEKEKYENITLFSDLKKREIFQDFSKNEKNIKIIQSFINSYYSSTYSIDKIEKLKKGANFFYGDDEFSIEIDINEYEKSRVGEFFKNEKLKKKYPTLLQQILLLVSKQIDFLSSRKAYFISQKQEKQIEVLFFDKDKKFIKKNFTIVPEYFYEQKRLLLVPHSYYYKKFYTILKKNPLFLKDIMQEYCSLFVDEAQDNDEIFFKTLIEIIKTNTIKTLVCVGDKYQSIYGFKSPGHADILSILNTNKNIIEKQYGLKFYQHFLQTTYRFGEGLAYILNKIFDQAKINGSQTSSFLFEHPIDYQYCQKIAQAKQEDNILKKQSIALITRTNQEAIKLFLKLSKNNPDLFKLNVSIKDEIKTFFQKGLNFFNNEKIKNKIIGILGEKEASYKKIINNEQAVKILKQNGFGHLVAFEKDEVDHILQTNKKRNNVFITTAHQIKGDEVDYAIVYSDFMRDNFSTEEEICNVLKEADKKIDNNSFDNLLEHEAFKDLFNYEQKLKGNEQKDDSKTEIKKNQQKDDIIIETDKDEEKNIFYVALTRAKFGVFILEDENNKIWDKFFKENIDSKFEQINKENIKKNYLIQKINNTNNLIQVDKIDIPKQTKDNLAVSKKTISL